MQNVTVEEIAAWLCENRCPTTLLELYSEWKTVHHKAHVLFLELAAACAPVDKVPVGSEDVTSVALNEAVVDMLVAYGKQQGKAALREAVKQATAQVASSDLSLVDDEKDESRQRCPPSAPVASAVVEHQPSFLTEAVKRETGSSNDSGTNMMSPFHLRLQHAEESLEQTITVLSKGLPTLVSAVDPMQKDVLIPIISLAATLNRTKSAKAAARLQLLTLYSRPNREHRAAVAEAWAMTLRNLPSSVLEYDIVPELINLANAKSTERHILALDCVMCVAPLFGTGRHALRKSICQGLLRPLSEDEARAVRFHVVQCITELWPIYPNDAEEKETSHADVSDSLSCYVELILRLALHDVSGTVRRCALRSLRNQLLLPVCTPCFVALTQIVPLLISCLERESAVLECDDMPMRKGASTSAVKSLDVVESAVASNVLTLASLIEDVLRHALECVTGEKGGVATLLEEAYLRVVLPSAYALVMMSHEQGTSNVSICALASALATVVPALCTDRWCQVRNSLEAFITQGSIGDCSSTEVWRSAGWRQRQLCFLFIFLTRLAGGTEAAGTLPSVDVDSIAKEASTWLREMLLVDVVDDERAKMHATNREQRGEAGDTERANELHSTVVQRSEASARLDACATCLVWFATRVDDGSGNAAAVSSMLWSFTESSEERQRMLAVALVERVSGLPMDDKVRETSIWPSLLLLMNDTVYEVKEAAMKATVSMVKFASTPAAQEKLMVTVVAIVEAEGCASRLGVAFLRHWCLLLREMPAEPRESFLYPQLANMINQLSDTMRRMEVRSAKFTVAGRGSSSPPSEQHKLTEDALASVLAVLETIPRCAVVTPQLVNKYLIPSIQLLGSLKSLPASSRSQLLSITKEYTALLDSSKGPRSTPNVLDRLRSELKKRL
ncbi:hypothetical protein TraAM80_03870 [Trypanosoma rangeli]|uniref:Uncharacterized protein n=1 Tax=Trypanosoma rangeli TaxID=5698 RepID=A0A3S5IRG6_TRYRA|nr:uncharacterized protein TraAM80_03870 [Trypanosoma rangeli]RNF06600.1 hypothetical protein TraAM80_03870 [Trypanosoma rangeli]|eukprot:RNF06600.1 hypothetical protein TraAM80_03870 [Trypanosoma rangeli]